MTEPDGNDRQDNGKEGLEARRRRLEAELVARRPASSGKSANTSGSSGYAQAIRLSSEFIAGVAVGAMLGYLMDRFFGTTPWGMIVMLLVGFAAGVLNVMRSAGVVAEPGIVTQDGAKGRDGDKAD